MFSMLTIVAMLAAMGTSCNKDDDTEPDLPPVSSLAMDFSDFTTFPDTTGLKSGSGIADGPYHTNFASSFLTVWTWNLLTGIAMVIPVAAYTEALQQTPAYMGDNEWQWSYSVTILLVSYDVKLKTKRIDNSTYSAKMYISIAGGFQDFLWFEGVVRYDATHAEWTLYKDPADPMEWLEVEWEMDWEEDTSSITYTYTEAGHAENGSSISFGITGDTDYDAFYSIIGSQSSVEIEMNTGTKAGRIMSHLYFGDTDWHCWNGDFQNITCP